jgi:hypothetical protein
MSPTGHDIVKLNQMINRNFSANARLFILQCNKSKNEAEKISFPYNGLHDALPVLPLSAPPTGRNGVNSLYLPKGNPGIAQTALQVIGGVCGNESGRQ